ncbi:carboxypeptidase-like regulatory domain-containing protein [Flagellimonas sp.]|uniref:carboxypeptidase-like regulatory domain-containing protein n=1 Tax=Flagellimonas sp. TaxID=2058762 RepID=UPI003BB2146C
MVKIKFLLPILFVLCSLYGAAQEISGVVLDSKTKEPITGASVYYDGSAVGTITNLEGNFQIPALSGSNAVLVIRHLGYKTEKLVRPQGTVHLRIILTEEAESLDEIIVTADPFSRKQKLNVFRLEFLGDTKGGKNSNIVNEEDIRLFFNTYNNTLTAHSDRPLIVQNDYLGYRISFEIEQFKIYFKSTSLKRIDNIFHTIYEGSAQFFDVASKNYRVLKRRKNAYEGSRMHFMRSCWKGNLLHQNFELRKKFKNIPTTEMFVVKNDSLEDFRNIQFLGEQFVIYHKKKGYYRSTLNIQKPETVFSLDRYGSCTPFKELVFGGYMADSRIGDMLPIDYGL